MQIRLNARLSLLCGPLAALGVAFVAGQAQQPQTPNREDFLKRSRDFSAGMEKKGLAEPFKGVTTDGTVVPNLFSVRSTGVSTEPVRNAAAAFLKTLDPQQRQKMSSSARIGRHAVTHWRVQQQFADERLSLLELALETGRTHQIRVHLSERNLPIVGDPVYGQRGRANNLADPELRRRVAALDRQALHARLLGFIHPAEERYLEFESPLPADMAAIVNYLATRHPGATTPR